MQDFKEDFLIEKVFANEQMRTLPCGAQSIAIHAFAEILSNLVEENPYVTVSELLSTNELSE